MTSRPVYIFVNGILDLPSESRGWTDRAVTWCQTRTSGVAEKFEYFAGVFSRRLFQESHAADLLGTLYDYWHRDIILVAHSNGADLALRAINRSDCPDIAHLHLFSPACSADFSRNGLATKLRQEELGQVSVYIAGQDEAMRWARLSQKLFGWLGLGYGTLGLTGPENVGADIEALVHTRRVESYAHSDWFLPENFNSTMEMITKH